MQYLMGTASTFLSAYTLATLHEVSIIAQASAFQFGSIPHAGHRLVGDREVSEAGCRRGFVMVKQKIPCEV